MVDITTKILLGLIALGLLANAANFAVRPVLAEDDYSTQLNNIESDLSSMKSDLRDIEGGTCKNNKLC